MRKLAALLLLVAVPILCARAPERSEPRLSAPTVQHAPSPATLDASTTPNVTAPADPLANVLSGQVTAVSDGDTLTVLDDTNTQHRIRLQGIDAPEGEQPFSDGSTGALREKVLGETVRVEWHERDRWRRTLGHIYLDGRYINQEMIADGWAWHYAYYWPDDEFAQAERDARAAKRGLWADERPVAPWDFRRNPELYRQANGAAGGTTGGPGAASGGAGASGPSGQSAPRTTTAPGTRDEALAFAATLVHTRPELRTTSGQVTVYITRTGEKYHASGCRHLRKSSIPISLGRAEQRYSPCGTCGGGGSAPRVSPPVWKSANLNRRTGEWTVSGTAGGKAVAAVVFVDAAGEWRLRRLTVNGKETFGDEDTPAGAAHVNGRAGAAQAAAERAPADSREQSPDERERRARGKLTLAKRLLDMHPETGREWLAEIVEEYSGTEAAKEAEELLRRLP